MRALPIRPHRCCRCAPLVLTAAVNNFKQAREPPYRMQKVPDAAKDLEVIYLPA